jgi:hypothetical protein
MLFFGRFYCTEQKSGKLIFKKHNNYPEAIHIIFGYMEIGEMLPCDDKDNIPEWVLYHPHVNQEKREGEHIFIASDSLKLEIGQKICFCRVQACLNLLI